MMQSRAAVDTQDRKGSKNRSIQSHFLSASNVTNSSNSVCSSSNGNGAGVWTSQEITEEEINAVIKTVIWLFRSSVNTHRPWTSSIPITPRDLGPNCGLKQNHGSSSITTQNMTVSESVKCEDSQVDNSCSPIVLSEEQTEYLEKKRKYAPYWGVICPSVKSYCEERKRDLEGKLHKYLHGYL